MNSTPRRSPEPWDSTIGPFASESFASATEDPAPVVVSGRDRSLDDLSESDPEESTEWGGAPEDTAAEWATLDIGDDAPELTATLYASGPGLPARGVLLTTAAAAAACVGIDFALTGALGFFFDLCFVVICLVAAMAAAPRALFTVGVMPPMVFAAAISVVAVIAPRTIADGSFSTVFLTGLAEHAGPLCAAYAVALVVACARGLALRGAQRGR